MINELTDCVMVMKKENTLKNTVDLKKEATIQKPSCRPCHVLIILPGGYRKGLGPRTPVNIFFFMAAFSKQTTEEL